MDNEVGLFESQERFEMFQDNDFEIMYLNQRVTYFKDYTEKIIFEKIQKCGKRRPSHEHKTRRSD